METITQTSTPVINVYASIRENKGTYEAKNSLYQVFSPTSDYYSGQNLQSYTFDRSVDNIVGSFTFTIKEDIEGSGLNQLFMDRVAPLDVITISENGDGNIDFIGVITTISFGATAGNLSKILSISGKSIEYLVKLFNISADLKGACFNNQRWNTQFKTDYSTRNGEKPDSVLNVCKSALTSFVNIANDYDSISNMLLYKVLHFWYNSDDTKNLWFDVDENLSFKYPISSNLFDGSKINFFDFIRRLLPDQVYEIYGIIKNNKPKIKIREVPFSNDDWSNLKTNVISGFEITDYTLSRNCDEVYTGFMSYVEGSPQSADFYLNRATAVMGESNKMTGYNTLIRRSDKASIYGLNLLYCNFIGFNSVCNKETTTDQNNKLSTLESNLLKLNVKLKEMYGDLDDMYNGDVTIVNIHSKTHAVIGEKIKLCSGEFYVTGEKHNWRYGDSPTINYQLSRGGDYSAGSFKKLSGISKPFAELM